MPRIARLIVKGEATVYHVMSRTALEGFVIGDIEKEYFLNLIKRLSRIYFAEVLGFCLMGNHFHLLVRMHPGDDVDDEEIMRRFSEYHGEDEEVVLGKDQIPYMREKWSSLSEYMKEIKQGFSRFYNRRHGRKGFFWSERFKSLIVDNGETLINCLAYIDLNPVRAGIVDRPEQYRWCSMGYHFQSNNHGGLLSLDLGLEEFGVKGYPERLRYYRRFVYEKGHFEGFEKNLGKDFEVSKVDRFRYRTRYFTDSGIIGSKAFVERIYRQFEDRFSSKREKRPKGIAGLTGIYSLKRLSEAM